MQDNTLMSLETKKIDFEKKIVFSESIIETLKPIVKERNDDDDNDKTIIDTITDVITEKRDNINGLKKEKENKILVMLGQIYKGVIVPQVLTCRNGQFYRYQCRYELGLDSVKEELLKNLHAVTENIKVEKNLDILECVLGKWDKDKDSTRSRYDDKVKVREKEFKFENIIIIENTEKSSHTPNTTFEFTHTNAVKVSEDGEIDFLHQSGEDKDTQHFQTENFNMLYLKFKNEIEGLADEFIKELDDEIKVRSNELENIKVIGSHLLMSAELQKGSDDIEGYGN